MADSNRATTAPLKLVVSRCVVSVACVMAESSPAPTMAAVDTAGGPSEAPSRSLCSSPLGKTSCGCPVTVDDETSDTSWRSTVHNPAAPPPVSSRPPPVVAKMPQLRHLSLAQ
ncbi:unnamed protein product [Lampetra planeri]